MYTTNQKKQLTPGRKALIKMDSEMRVMTDPSNPCWGVSAFHEKCQVEKTMKSGHFKRVRLKLSVKCTHVSLKHQIYQIKISFYQIRVQI